MRAVSIFIPTFLIIMFLNQMSYGACFKGYCLEAAFPKVLFLSLGISLVIYYATNNSSPAKSKRDDEFINSKHEPDLVTTRNKTYSVNEIQKTYSNAYKKWTYAEEKALIEAYKQGLTIQELSVKFGRQTGGIRSRLRKLGLVA